MKRKKRIFTTPEAYEKWRANREVAERLLQERIDLINVEFETNGVPPLRIEVPQSESTETRPWRGKVFPTRAAYQKWLAHGEAVQRLLQERIDMITVELEAKKRPT